MADDFLDLFRRLIVSDDHDVVRIRVHGKRGTPHAAVVVILAAGGAAAVIPIAAAEATTAKAAETTEAAKTTAATARALLCLDIH